VIAGELAQGLHALVSRLDAAADDLLRREFAISHSQLGFLMPLLDHRELDVTTLAAANRVSVPAVSKRVAWFTERGLISTRHPASGGRQVLLSLTPKGRRLATSASQRLRHRLDELVADWPDARRDLLRELVAELTDTIDENSGAIARRAG
jgi:DNA-binding MarR family transcriptional regulator